MDDDGLSGNLLAYMRGEIRAQDLGIKKERDTLRKALGEAVALIYAQRNIIGAYGRVLGAKDDPADAVLLRATICSQCHQVRPAIGALIKCRLGVDTICTTCGNVMMLAKEDD